MLKPDTEEGGKAVAALFPQLLGVFRCLLTRFQARVRAMPKPDFRRVTAATRQVAAGNQVTS
ncbi:hypothetical protein AGR7B_Cc40020 [Agrobacterium deltaense RV3]|nr:hypothetical protein AGR7B_Cc40020 [Agrobacterium deltaense RV3]